MDIEQLRAYCLQKPGATESFPFGNETLVFKVGGKVFLLAGLEEGDRFNAKCDPELAIEWREQYPEIIPGFHMNKKHWNTVRLDGSLKNAFIREVIDQSYAMVVKSLPAKVRVHISYI
jgi:predicted DNA-binding protein (MmcQ/YjbR family)